MASCSQLAPHETTFKSSVSKAVLDLGQLRVLQGLHLVAHRNGFTCAGQDSV